MVRFYYAPVVRFAAALDTPVFTLGMFFRADVRIRPEAMPQRVNQQEVAMPRKKHNLLLQPHLPTFGLESPPRHLHAVVTVTSHLIKADRGVQMALPENASRHNAASPTACGG